MKPRPPALQTLKFILIAIVMMLIADHFVFGGKRSYIEEARQNAPPVERPHGEVDVAAVAAIKPPPVHVLPPDGKAFFEAPPSEGAGESEIKRQAEVPTKEKPRSGRARIAIIIDDVGMDIKRSRAVIDLPAAVTLAYLPYAPQVRTLAKEGKAKGHEIIIHTPMAAMDAHVNIGPGGLHEGMSAAEIHAAFSVMLGSFEGYDGINNHMGSRLTQDRAAMDVIAAMLKERGLFFIDSKTSDKSVVGAAARAAGVPHAARDVFLDHVDSADFVRKALAQTERKALAQGSAIAIGHPKDHTIAGLRAWLPTLKDKGIDVVPVSALLQGVQRD